MTAKRLARANLILNNACKQAGLDPVQMRVEMTRAIKVKLATVGKGYGRLPPATPEEHDDLDQRMRFPEGPA